MTLLYQFRKEVGLPQPAGANDLEGRWEGDAVEYGFVRGHITGHWLSAASREYALTGDTTYLNRINDVVAGLGQVQDAFTANGEAGYLSAFPSSNFTELENNQISWPRIVPYYTIHKIMAGLNDANTYTGNTQALDIAYGMADYFVNRVSGLSQSVKTQMVQSQYNQSREFGSMNEVLTDLYVKANAASDPRAQGYLELADVFNNRTLMDQIAAGNDVLSGTHANTHIAQAVGWARYAQVTGDQNVKNGATNFWDMVLRDHTFVTGGNSYGEHFSTPGKETGTNGSALSWNTAETCNTYNMLKLTRTLFEQDPQAKYAAYAENALINNILPSIDPNKGTVTYFMSLEPGRFKTYSTYQDYNGAFWCCFGTGLENPTRYADLTYFKNADALYVNTFMPSQVNWSEKGITLTQDGDSTTADQTMHMTVNTANPTDAQLKVRIPSWANGPVTVTINGQAYTGDVKRGEYLTLDRQWQDGDQIEVTMDKNLYIRRSRDDPSMVSVYYGAVLLAGELGTQNLPGNDQEAVNDWDYSSNAVPSGLVPDIDAVNADPSSWLVPVPGQDMHFELYDNGSPTGIIFKPFYDTHHERYSVYWKLNAPAGTRTWRGGGMDLIQDGTNWDVAPAAGDSVVFDGDLTTSIDNNYASGTALNNITFASGAAAFNIHGNRINVQGDVTNLSPQTQTIATDLQIDSGNHAFNATNAPMVISGNLQGAGTLVKNGSHTLTLTGNNTHSQTIVNEGELRVGDGGTSGSIGSGDVTLANNATIAFDHSDNITLNNAISGQGNLKKRGAGDLTVITPQAYSGQTLIEQGTLRLGTGSVANGIFTLDFDSASGTVSDKDGQASGFTRRLAGTADPTNDANLDLDTANGQLLVTSGGPADFHNEVNLSDIEAPGINLSDLGIDAGSDFTVSASFADAPNAANYRQYGVYVGDSAYRLIRGGYLTIDNAGIFGVNNTGGSGSDSGLSNTTFGAPAAGGSMDVVLSRISGVFTLTVNGVDVTPSSQLSELNSLSDLTLGVFSLHTSSSSGAFTVPLTQFSVSSPDLPAQVYDGGLPTDTDVVIAAGAVLDLNDMSQTVASLAGSAGSSLMFGSGMANVLMVNGASGSTQFDGSITGQGQLVKAGNATLILGGDSSFDGPVSVQGGVLALLSGASISGISSVDVQPGATLAVELSAPGNLDLLSVLGTFTAGGTLDVTLAAGAAAPQSGDTYDLFDFISAGGAFNAINLPTLSSALEWDTSSLLTTGELSVVGAALPGDLNGDGYVGLDDLQLVLDNWNLTVPDGHPSDVNGDNYVGLDDLQPVLDHWNEGTPAPTSTIPEPASLILFGLGTLACMRRRRSA